MCEKPVLIAKLNGSVEMVSIETIGNVRERLAHDISVNFTNDCLTFEGGDLVYKVQVSDFNGKSCDLINIHSANRHYMVNVVKAYVSTVLNKVFVEHGLEPVVVKGYLKSFDTLVTRPELRKKYVASYRAREYFPFEEFPLRGIYFELRKDSKGVLSDKVRVRLESDFFKVKKSCVVSEESVNSLRELFEVYLNIEKEIASVMKRYFNYESLYVTEYHEFEDLVLERALAYRDSKLASLEVSA